MACTAPVSLAADSETLGEGDRDELLDAAAPVLLRRVVALALALRAPALASVFFTAVFLPRACRTVLAVDFGVFLVALLCAAVFFAVIFLTGFLVEVFLTAVFFAVVRDRLDLRPEGFPAELMGAAR